MSNIVGQETQQRTKKICEFCEICGKQICVICGYLSFKPFIKNQNSAIKNRLSLLS
jgi:hypothetical protein